MKKKNSSKEEKASKKIDVSIVIPKKIKAQKRLVEKKESKEKIKKNKSSSLLKEKKLSVKKKRIDKRKEVIAVSKVNSKSIQKKNLVNKVENQGINREISPKLREKKEKKAENNFIVDKQKEKSNEKNDFSSLSIRFVSYYHFALEEEVKSLVDFLKKQPEVYKVTVSRLKTKIKRFSIIKAHFADKDKKEHYEIRFHRRLVVIRYRPDFNLLSLVKDFTLSTTIETTVIEGSY